MGYRNRYKERRHQEVEFFSHLMSVFLDNPTISEDESYNLTKKYIDMGVSFEKLHGHRNLFFSLMNRYPHKIQDVDFIMGKFKLIIQKIELFIDVPF